MMHGYFGIRLTDVTCNVNTVLIGESPVNIECKVKQIIPLGSHDMFIADVVNVNIDEKLLDPKTNKLRLDKASLFTDTYLIINNRGIYNE